MNSGSGAVPAGGFVVTFVDVDGRPSRLEGLLGFGLIYEFQDAKARTLRVYVDGDNDGRATIVSQEEIDPGAALGPVALSRKVRAHLDSLLGGDTATTVRWCGIDPGAALRTHRGPPRSWTAEQLALLSRRIVEREELGLDPVDFAANERWRLNRRTVRELAREAERRGLLEIVTRPGRTNVYAFPSEPASGELAEPPLETMRWARFELERKRRELHVNWERSHADCRS